MESFFCFNEMGRALPNKIQAPSRSSERQSQIYIKFYNETRPHAKNGYKTPARKEQEYYAKSKRNEKK